MKKKISVLNFNYTFKLGGVEKNLINMLKHTDKNENISHSVVIFHSEISDDFAIKELESLGCKIYKIPMSETKNLFTLFKILKIIIKNKINVLSINDVGSLKWMAASKFFFPAIKAVFVINDTNLVNALSKKDNFLVRKFVDANIAVSTAVKSEAEDCGLKKIQIINYGIEAEKYSSQKEKINFYTEELKIVNTGWLRYPKKGQDILIKALGICKNRGVKFTCDFIGAAHSEEAVELYNRLIKENNLEQEINFLGFKSNIHELLGNYNLFAFPSRYEGFGIVFMEAMAAGLPVISNSIDAPKELIINGDNGYLFKKDDHQDLADKITEVYHNRETLKKVAENGYNFSKNFDISIMVQNYNNIYKKLLKL